jgi:hypothetical protein
MNKLKIESMNKWVRRLIKITVSFFLVFIIFAIWLFNNKDHDIDSLHLPLYVIYIMFQIPYLVCYSSWANKKIWKRNNSQNI